MSGYLRSVPKSTTKQEDQVEEQLPKQRRVRGTSEFVQVKVPRALYETLGVVGKMNSLSTAYVIEKILEAQVSQFRDTLNSLKLDNIL